MQMRNIVARVEMHIVRWRPARAIMRSISCAGRFNFLQRDDESNSKICKIFYRGSVFQNNHFGKNK